MVWAQNAFEFLCKGGPVMVPLVLCSVVSVAVMVEKYVRLRQAAGDSEILMARVENWLAMGKIRDAVRACEQEQTPLGDMLACGLRCRDRDQAEKCMEEQALKSTPDLFKHLSILDTVITIAPLLGLLGTIVGMIRAFNIVATVTGVGSPTGIMGGVAEALIATATGLAIAIVTLVGYNYLNERVKAIVSDMEFNGTRLVNILSAGEEESREAEAVGA